MQPASSNVSSVEAFRKGVLKLIGKFSLSVENAVSNHVRLWLIAFSAVLFVGSGTFAAGSPFSANESVTVVLSSLSGWSQIWWTLEQGTELNPPLYFLLAHTSQQIFGYGHLGARLPALLSVWMGSMALFAFVNRRTAPVYAFAAMLAPFAFFLTGNVSTLARGYPLLFGFSALALLCWQVTAGSSGVKRKAALAGLALSLFAVEMSHYYGVLTILCIGLGELFRTGRSRRFDFPVLLMILVGSSSLIVLLPIIQAVTQYSYHTQPSAPAALSAYSHPVVSG